MITNDNTVKSYLGIAKTNPDGKIRQPKNDELGIMTLHFFLGIKTTYKAYVNGIRFKNDKNDFWKWEDYTFNKVAQNAGITPPCFSVSLQGLNVTTIIDQDRKIARANVKGLLIVSLSCGGDIQMRVYNINNSSTTPAGD